MILNDTKEAVREQLTGLLRTVELPWTVIGELEVKGKLPYFITEFQGTRIEVHPKKVKLNCVHDLEDGTCDHKEIEISKEINAKLKGSSNDNQSKDSLLYRQLYMRFMDNSEVSILQDIQSRLLSHQESIEVDKQEKENAEVEGNETLKIAKEKVRQLQASVINETKYNRKLIIENRELVSTIKNLKKSNSSLIIKKFNQEKFTHTNHRVEE